MKKLFAVFLISLGILMSVPAQDISLNSLDFFALPWVNESTDLVKIAFGNPEITSVDDPAIQHRLEWEEGIWAFLDMDGKVVRWSRLSQNEVGSSAPTHLFGPLYIYQSSEDDLFDALGDPDRREKNLATGGEDWYYAALGMQFHLRTLVNLDGTVSFSPRIVRVDISPNSFDSKALRSVLGEKVYNWQNLFEQVGKSEEDLVYYFGPPQYLETSPGQNIAVYHYPSHGMLYMVDQDTKKALLYALMNEVEIYERYAGALPKGLSFQDQLITIEDKIGSPSEKLEQSGRIVCTFSQGLQIHFAASGRLETLVVTPQFNGF